MLLRHNHLKHSFACVSQCLLSPLSFISLHSLFWVCHLGKVMAGGLWLGEVMGEQCLEGFSQEKPQKRNKQQRK